MEIRDTNAQLEGGRRYLLYFRIPVLGTDTQRKLSDEINIRATFANQFLNKVDFELQGTAVKAANDVTGDPPMFLALVKVTGTPLIALVNPIVQIAFIVTLGVVVLIFVKAVLVPTFTPIGAGIKDVAEGLKDIGKGAGEGLKFALPLIGVGVSIVLAISLITAVRR